MDDQVNAGDADGGRRISRRDALKKGAIGAGVVGVVWAAPEIVGLAVAPAYAAAGSISAVACSGDATFDLTITCPPGGHGSKNVQPTGGNCPLQGITVDSHFAIGTPTDTTKDVPDQFTDITPQDAPVTYPDKGIGSTHNNFTGWKTFHSHGNSDINATTPPYIIVGIHRANVHCSFTGATFAGTNSEFFNPHTKQKFNGAFQTTSDISIGWASDFNERADLGAPFCSNTDTKAHVTMHCM